MKKTWRLICLCLAVCAACLMLIGCFGGDEEERIDLSSLIPTVHGGQSFRYTGEAQHPTISFGDKIKTYYTLDTSLYCTACGGSAHEELDIVFEGDHTSLGRTVITIMAKEDSRTFSGHAGVSFTIVPAAAKANDYASLVSKLADEGNESVTLASDITIPAGQTLTVPYDRTLYLDGHTLTNEGKLHIDGILNISGEGAVIYNTGAFTLGDDGDIYATDALNCKIYTNAGLPFPTSVAIPQHVNTYIRFPAEQLALINLSYVYYNAGDHTPTVMFRDGVEIPVTDYTVTYENNRLPGEATVTVTATNPYSEYIYGSATRTFDIYVPAIEIVSRDALEEYLADPAYDTFHLRAGVYETLELPAGRRYILYDTIQIGSLTNYGDMQVAEHTLLTADTITNMAGGTIANEGEIRVASHLVNQGSFINQKDLFAYSTVTDTAWQGIDNRGCIYYNDTSPLNHAANGIANGEGGSIVLRIPIDAAYITYTAARDYNKEAFVPSLSFIDDYPHAIGNDYAKTVYAGNNPLTSPNDAVGAGDYTMELDFHEWSKSYYGKASIDYTINRSAVQVATFKDLRSALLTSSYYEVTLTRSLVIEENLDIHFSTLIIQKGVTLTLSANKQLSNIGTSQLTIGGVEGRLINRGTIVNLYNEESGAWGSEENANIRILASGTLVNEGVMYLNDNANILSPASTGTAIVRKPASEAVITVSGVLVYGEGTLEGVTSAALGETALARNTDYTLSYPTYAKRGLTATLIAEDKSRYIYGSTSFTFDRLQTTKWVSSYSGLTEALASGSEYGVCNYHTIIATSRINVPLYSDDITIVIPEGTTLQLGDYYLDYTMQENFGGSQTVTILNYGTITSHIPQLFNKPASRPNFLYLEMDGGQYIEN